MIYFLLRVTNAIISSAYIIGWSFLFTSDFQVLVKNIDANYFNVLAVCSDFCHQDKSHPQETTKD